MYLSSKHDYWRTRELNTVISWHNCILVVGTPAHTAPEWTAGFQRAELGLGLSWCEHQLLGADSWKCCESQTLKVEATGTIQVNDSWDLQEMNNLRSEEPGIIHRWCSYEIIEFYQHTAPFPFSEGRGGGTLVQSLAQVVYLIIPDIQSGLLFNSGSNIYDS